MIQALPEESIHAEFESPFANLDAVDTGGARLLSLNGTVVSSLISELIIYFLIGGYHEVDLKEAQGMKEAIQAKVASKAIEGCAFHEGPFTLSNLPSMPKRIWSLAKKPDIHGSGVSQIKKCLLDSHGLELTYDWTFNKDSGLTPERVMAKWFSPTGKENAVFQMIFQIGLDVSKCCVVFGGPYPLTKRMKMLGPKSCIEMTLDLDGDAVEGGLVTTNLVGRPAATEVTTAIKNVTNTTIDGNNTAEKVIFGESSESPRRHDRIHIGERLGEVLRQRGEPMVRLHELEGHPSQEIYANDFMPNAPLAELLQIDATEVTQTTVQAGMASFVVNLEFALEIDMQDGDNKLTLILKGTLEPGRFILLGWMQYVWCNPFKLSKSTCIANLELSIGVSPGVPFPTQGGGGGSFGIGKDCPLVMKKMFAGGKNGAVNGAVNSTCGKNANGAACMDAYPELKGKECTMATFYIGIDMLSPWDSYFSASFSKIVLDSVLKWVSPSKTDALGTFLKNSGFPKGLTFSYATIDIDIMAFTIQAGISFAGTINVFGWEAMCNFRFEDFPKLFTFEVALNKISLGMFTHVYKTEDHYQNDILGDGAVAGPYMNLVIQFVKIGIVWVIKEMPKVHIQGFLSIDGLCDAYSMISVNNIGMTTVFEGVMWKVIRIVQRQEIIYPKNILRLDTARVAFEVQLQARELSAIFKTLRKMFVRRGKLAMKKLKQIKKKMAYVMGKLGLTSSTAQKSLKEDMSLVYARDEVLKRMRRTRYEGKELGEAKEEHLPRCCEGTKLEMAQLRARLRKAENDNLGEDAKWGDAVNAVSSAATATADAASTAATATADAASSAATATADAASSAATVTADAAVTVGNAAVAVGQELLNFQKMYKNLKTTFSYLVRAVKGFPLFMKTLITKGPNYVFWPCGASVGGELSGPKQELIWRNVVLLWKNRKEINMKINFQHILRSARKIYTLIKGIVLEAFAQGKRGNDKCSFKIRGSKKYGKPKRKLKPNDKMPTMLDLKSTEKPKPKKAPWPPPKKLDPVQVVNAEEKARERNQRRQDIEESRKDQNKVEHDLINKVAKVAKKEEAEGKKKLLEAAIFKKTVDDAKEAEIHGNTKPYEAEAKEKAEIAVNARLQDKVKRQAGLKKIKLHVSPLATADPEEQLLIHAFIAGYSAGDKDAAKKFGAQNAKRTPAAPKLATVAAKDIEKSTLLSPEAAFRAGYAARYAEVRNVARRVKRIMEENKLSIRSLGSVLTLDEEL